MTDSKFSTEFFRVALKDAVPVRVNKNSHIVWQLLYDGFALQGPPVKFRGGWVAGPSGWKTKREAVAALAELREQEERRAAPEDRLPEAEIVRVIEDQLGKSDD